MGKKIWILVILLFTLFVELLLAILISSIVEQLNYITLIGFILKISLLMTVGSCALVILHKTKVLILTNTNLFEQYSNHHTLFSDIILQFAWKFYLEFFIMLIGTFFTFPFLFALNRIGINLIDEIYLIFIPCSIGVYISLRYFNYHKKLSNKTLLLTFLLVLTFIFVKEMYPTNNSLNLGNANSSGLEITDTRELLSVSDCEDQQKLLSYIQQEWRNSNNIKIEPNIQAEYHRSFSDVQWKRNSFEPYVVYRGESLSYIYFENTSLEHINELFSENINTLFSESGFNRNELNTGFVASPNPSSPFFDYNFYSFGYTKDNQIYWIIVYPKHMINDNSGLVVGKITCGIKENQLDEMYTELLFQPSVQKNLTSLYLPVFVIDAIYNDKVVETVISSYVYGGGSSHYFLNENGNWKEIYAGQDLPSCSLLENYNIGPGIECYDEVMNVTRTK